MLYSDYVALAGENKSAGLRRRMRKGRQLWGLLSGLVAIYSAVFASPNPAMAQQPSVFTGSVVDSRTTTPVAGAVAVLAGTLHGLRTDSEGYFEFSGLNPGKYSLIVSAEGYIIFRDSVQIQGDLHLEIRLESRADQLPDQHTFLGPNAGLADWMYSGLLPRRVNAIDVEYTLYESPIDPKSLYLDGIRMIDPAIPILAFADMEQAEIVPSPYNPGLGMDASIHYQTRELHSTGGELVYSSRKRGVRSGLTLHQDWTHTQATLTGSYERTSNYTDGGGTPQHAGIRSGNIAGRVGMRLAPFHRISGSGGWLHDVNQSGAEIQQQAVMMQYKYVQNAGFLQAIAVSASHQQMQAGSSIGQQSGAASLHLSPGPSLRLRIGADYYRYKEQEASPHGIRRDDKGTIRETGLYIEAVQRVSPLLMEGQFRLNPVNRHWGGATLLTWLVSSEWQLLAAAGRVYSPGMNSSVRQADLGMRWNGFQKSVKVTTFIRGAEGRHAYGMTASAHSLWWEASFYTAVSEPASRPSTWARIRATVTGPFDLFMVSSDLYGTLSHSPAWVSTDLWMESRDVSGVSLRIGIQNLFDGTFSYPYGEFAEPGRSFRFGLSYGSKS